MSVRIEEWGTGSPGWGGLLQLIDALGQREWATYTAEWHRSSRFLVALSSGVPVGFLRWVEQETGSDAGRPPFNLDGEVLVEAKVLAFGVVEGERRRGIGRALQEHLIRLARSEGLHQIRSRSDGSNTANHALKLSLGYGVQPAKRAGDEMGAYFILPLRGRTR